MIHYTCDRCKREIDNEHDLRFVVRMEFEPAVVAGNANLSEDVDNLEALEAYLESTGSYDENSLADDLLSQKRYDLCNSCYRHFSSNPFGVGVGLPLGFSKN
jgi:hypothetical protein